MRREGRSGGDAAAVKCGFTGEVTHGTLRCGMGWLTLSCPPGVGTSGLSCGVSARTTSSPTGSGISVQSWWASPIEQALSGVSWSPQGSDSQSAGGQHCAGLHAASSLTLPSWQKQSTSPCAPAGNAMHIATSMAMARRKRGAPVCRVLRRIDGILPHLEGEQQLLLRLCRAAEG